MSGGRERRPVVSGACAHRIEHGVQRRAPVSITVDGEPVEAFPGESIASALLAAGRRIVRRTASGAPRGVFCNMGVCFECVVVVDGSPGVRACQTPVRPGMVIVADGSTG